MSSPRALLLTGLLLAAATAAAQERPSEDALFGGGPAADAGTPAAPPPAPQPASPPTAADRPSEESMFGGAPSAQAPASGTAQPEAATPKAEPPVAASPAEKEREAAELRGGAKDAFDTGEAGPEDPLRIGGQFYMRSFAQVSKDVTIASSRLSVPMLVDGYFDARPNDQLRGMLVARLSYDPLLGPNGAPPFGPGLPSLSAPNPSVGIDQLWLRFDIAHSVFVTAGRQHVHWGVGHVWAPTDYLTPQRRDPLAPFDLRLGATMLKVHVPWEAQGWNFYAVGMYDNAFATAGQTTAGGSGSATPGVTNQPGSVGTPTSLLDGLGGAARAEVVLGKAELGADAVFLHGRKPRFGVDLSSALGPIDVYADIGFHQGSDRNLIRFTQAFDPGISYALQTETYQPEGTTLQGVLGASYTISPGGSDTLTFGGEYFYNSIGYEDPRLYPWLLVTGNYQAFYTGKHYAALTATYIPDSRGKTSFTVTTLGNLSDKSYISRVDVFVRVLTYLQVEAFAAAHYGHPDGEFRLGLDLPAAALTPALQLPADIHAPPPLLDLGVGLRMSI